MNSTLRVHVKDNPIPMLFDKWEGLTQEIAEAYAEHILHADLIHFYVIEKYTPDKESRHLGKNWEFLMIALVVTDNIKEMNAKTDFYKERIAIRKDAA